MPTKIGVQTLQFVNKYLKFIEYFLGGMVRFCTW